MSHEMMLVNSIENMIVEYESRLGAMTNGFLDKAGAMIQQARFDFIIVIFKKSLLVFRNLLKMMNFSS